MIDRRVRALSDDRPNSGAEREPFSTGCARALDYAFDPRMSDESDAALMTRSADGGPAAAAELYRRHANAVYRFVWASTGSESEAADVLQDTFTMVLERRSRFDPARGSCTAPLTPPATKSRSKLSLNDGIRPSFCSWSPHAISICDAGKRRIS
jgi:hypothetical protein